MSLDTTKEISPNLLKGFKANRKRGRPAKVKEIVKKEPKKQEHFRLPQEKPSQEFIKKAGRPTVYEPWMCDKIIEIASQGGSRSKMIVALGIRREATLNEWCEKYPEFKEAYEICKHYHLAYHEEINLQNAKGEIKGNATSMALTLNNYHSDIYKRNPDGGSNNKTEININTINVPASQLSQVIAQKLAACKSYGVDFLPNTLEAPKRIIDNFDSEEEDD